VPELSVVVPTLEERENVQPLVDRLTNVLQGIDYEIIFVDDDSGDGTSAAVRRLAQTNPRIRILHRIGRRGLSSAAMEGMLSSSAPYLAVMDADLQHDESILPLMFDKIKPGSLDLVVATRHTAGGSTGDMPAHRRMISDLGRRLSAIVCRSRLTDPMSGFFMVTHSYLDEVAHSVSGTGFKILLDLVVSARRPISIGEVPFTFRQRLHGQSKLDIKVALEYLMLVADKLVGDFVPATYVVFGSVGAIGVLVHLLIVRALRLMPSVALDQAQLISSAFVIGLNFVLNNQFTFRAARLRGAKFVLGMLLFYVACSVGLFLNLRVLDYFTAHDAPWYLGAAAGLIAGSVWNYWVSSMLVWQVLRRRQRSVSPLSS
jgi:dolichol-phosphate mannosyltransferase